MIAQSGRPARVLIPSMRRLNPHAAWTTISEFEDVVRSVDDVDVIELQPDSRFDRRQRIARSVAWHGRQKLFASLNPGVKPVRVERDYDVFAYFCINDWDLLYLNAVSGWQDRCRVKLCFMSEQYAGLVKRSAHILRLLEGFDRVFIPFTGSIGAVEAVIGRPTRFLPVAADMLRFSPYPDPPARVIDVYSMGRRSEAVHKALRAAAREKGLFYFHDTIPGPMVKPTNAIEHRELVASIIKRTNFFVVFPAKFGDDETVGQSEMGNRYFEGLAGGAVLLGQEATTPAFKEMFPWPDAVLPTGADGRELEGALSMLLRRPGEVERMSKRNALEALRRHDWSHRWATMLKEAGVAPAPALRERHSLLESIASAAESRRESVAVNP